MAKVKNELSDDFKTEDGISFFSEIDLNKDGGVSSSYPAWYNQNFLDKMNDEISKLDSSIKHGLVAEKNRSQVLIRIKEMKDRRDKIIDSIPKLTDVQKDKLSGYYKEFGDKIKESLYSRSDMKKGTADAHEEARRMADPCISLTKPMLDLCKAANVRVTGDRVSRNGAAKVWKLLGKRLGEPTNTEHLRKD